MYEPEERLKTNDRRLARFARNPDAKPINQSVLDGGVRIAVVGSSF